MIITEKEMQAYKLRQDGVTFRKIGEMIGGVSASRAMQLIYSAERKINLPHAGRRKIFKGLSTRATNCLSHLDYEKKEDIVKDIRSEVLHPQNGECKNYGWKSHIEVCEWLGLPKPKRKPPFVCPHCGKRYRIGK